MKKNKPSVNTQEVVFRKKTDKKSKINEAFSDFENGR